MKKIYIEEPNLDTYLEVINGVGDIHCEMIGGKPCRVEQIIIKRNPANGCSLYTLRLSTAEAMDAGEYNEDQIRLFHREFEDGDYVRQQGGDIIICAGIDHDHYLFHAALEEETGDIHYPDSNFYHYGRVMPGDRLCTEGEMMEINGRLMKQGKIFDIVQKKVVDSIFKQNPGLWKKFLREYEKYRRYEHEDKTENQGADTDVSRGGKQTTVEKFKATAMLPYPLSCHRGVLHTLGDVREALAAYEDRIQELTDMCDEVYAKLKDAEAQPITTNP